MRLLLSTAEHRPPQLISMKLICTFCFITAPSPVQQWGRAEHQYGDCGQETELLLLNYKIKHQENADDFHMHLFIDSMPECGLEKDIYIIRIL